jgi:cis-3-alkyl-4-acyloxetan-2-one decarboxylase
MALHLTPRFDGDRKAHKIVFLQGWPDDLTVWDEAVADLSRDYCCVRVNMPGYGDAGSATPTTDEVVDAIVALLHEVAGDDQVTLVLHDWGSYWGHAAHHRVPELVARVASLDVSPHYKATPKAMAGIVVYQGWLYGAFKIGGGIGAWMTRKVAELGRAPGDISKMHSGMNYPYRNIWSDLASGRAGQLTKGYWPTCPLLFMYGARKPFPFHSQAWVDHVRKVGGEVVEVQSGHWVQKKPIFLEAMRGWLKRTDQTTSRNASGSARSPGKPPV